MESPPRGKRRHHDAPDLPAELRVALERKSLGLSRSDAAQRASAISQTYRGGGGSATIRSGVDALAYALARMPATYAAVIASLNALSEVRPDFAPATLLDVGAGPGTATWAAAQVFESLNEFAALDSQSGTADPRARSRNRHTPRDPALQPWRSKRRAARCDTDPIWSLRVMSSAKPGDVDWPRSAI